MHNRYKVMGLLLATVCSLSSYETNKTHQLIEKAQIRNHTQESNLAWGVQYQIEDRKEMRPEISLQYQLREIGFPLRKEEIVVNSCPKLIP